MAEAIPADDPAGVRDPHMPRYFARSDKSYKVLRLDPARDLWRSAPVLLAARSSEEGPDPAPVMRQLEAVAGRAVSRKETVGVRFLGVAANAQGPVTEAWRDERLPFSISVVADEEKYERLQESVEAAESEGRRLRARLRHFAEAYLAPGESKADPAAVDRLVDELAPGLEGYWNEVAPEGERFGVEPPDMTQWRERLQQISRRTFAAAVGRLPLDARRLEAEFRRTTEETGKTKKREKAPV